MGLQAGLHHTFGHVQVVGRPIGVFEHRLALEERPDVAVFARRPQLALGDDVVQLGALDRRRKLDQWGGAKVFEELPGRGDRVLDLGAGLAGLPDHPVDDERQAIFGAPGRDVAGGGEVESLADDVVGDAFGCGFGADRQDGHTLGHAGDLGTRDAVGAHAVGKVGAHVERFEGVEQRIEVARIDVDELVEHDHAADSMVGLEQLEMFANTLRRVGPVCLGRRTCGGFGAVVGGFGVGVARPGVGCAEVAGIDAAAAGLDRSHRGRTVEDFALMIGPRDATHKACEGVHVDQVIGGERQVAQRCRGGNAAGDSMFGDGAGAELLDQLVERGFGLVLAAKVDAKLVETFGAPLDEVHPADIAVGEDCRGGGPTDREIGGESLEFGGCSTRALPRGVGENDDVGGLAGEMAGEG